MQSKENLHFLLIILASACEQYFESSKPVILPSATNTPNFTTYLNGMVSYSNRKTYKALVSQVLQKRNEKPNSVWSGKHASIPLAEHSTVSRLSDKECGAKTISITPQSRKTELETVQKAQK